MYKEDDWVIRRVPAHPRRHDIRSDYERDRSRVIHSASFRRLQTKTQVIGVSEGDFHRTRLTHSMEAAQIGRGIVLHLKATTQSQDPLDALPPLELVETICLAHDLGHPPFGHGGERALNFAMQHVGGFEGNGQTLRILSFLEKHTEGHGLNLSRRSLFGILKYPMPYSQVQRYSTVPQSDSRLFGVQDAKPPKCYLDSEKEVVEWILRGLDNDDRQALLDCAEPDGTKAAHAKPRHKGLDTSILELADDIAYGVHDLEDMVSLRLVLREDWDRLVETDERARQIGKDLTDLADRLFSGTSYSRKEAIGGFVNRLVTSTRVEEIDAFHHPLLRYRAVLEEPSRLFLDVLGELVYKTVVSSSEVQTLEYRGQQVVLGLVQAFRSDPARMLPGDSMRRYIEADSSGARERVICDYVAGMTDGFAERIYQRLFMPGSGSVFQRM